MCLGQQEQQAAGCHPAVVQSYTCDDSILDDLTHTCWPTKRLLISWLPTRPLHHARARDFKVALSFLPPALVDRSCRWSELDYLMHAHRSLSSVLSRTTDLHDAECGTAALSSASYRLSTSRLDRSIYCLCGWTQWVHLMQTPPITAHMHVHMPQRAHAVEGLCLTAWGMSVVRLSHPPMDKHAHTAPRH